MNKLITVLLLALTMGAVAQTKYKVDLYYGSLSADMNMALGLKDNPNTTTSDKGFDWDLEVGVAYNHVGVYIFYGRFNEFNYQNYGAGVDYYFYWLHDFAIDLVNPFNGRKIFKAYDGIDFSLGVYYSDIIRRNSYGAYGSYTAWVSPRGQIIFWNGSFGLVFKAQYQSRPELNKYIFETSLGLIFKRDR